VRAIFERIARAGWPVLAGVLLGLGVGGIWTLAQPDRYRAEARVLVRGEGSRSVLGAVEALAEGSVLEQNVAQTLRMARRPRVSATVGEGGVVTLSVEAGSGDRARQIDAEAALVLIQLVAARFGDTGVKATMLDPAHPAEQTSPTPGRNLLITGVIGLAAGLAAAAGLARRRQVPFVAGALDPAVARRLKARIDAVAKRERALARRAGELAEREQRLGRREEELAAAAGRPAPSRRREPEPELVPMAVQEPEPQPAALLEAGPRHWNLHALETLVRERGSADPAQVEEWNTYLFFLREHAESDGTLPASFDSLVNEVFGELLRGAA
jgi:hypothetical protein